MQYKAFVCHSRFREWLCQGIFVGSEELRFFRRIKLVLFNAVTDSLYKELSNNFCIGDISFLFPNGAGDHLLRSDRIDKRERISPPYEDLLAESMIFPGGLGTEEAFLLQEILGYDPFFQIRFRIWNFIMPPLLFRIILLCIVHTDVQFLRSDIDADVLHKEEKKEKM
jgi:hypothetical protein